MSLFWWARAQSLAGEGRWRILPGTRPPYRRLLTQGIPHQDQVKRRPTRKVYQQPEEMPRAAPHTEALVLVGLGSGWTVIVGDVIVGGPAAIAGIVEKDVLVDVAGQSVNSYSAVADAVVDHVHSTPAGTPGVVHVMRNGVPHEFIVFFDREFVLRR